MNFFAATGLILGVTSLILVVVLGAYSRTKLHRVWTLFNVSVAVWGFSLFNIGIATNESQALISWKFANLGGGFLAPLLLHIVYIFADIKSRKIIAIAYLQILTFVIIDFANIAGYDLRLVYGSFYYPSPTGIILPVFLIFWLLIVVYGFYELVRCFLKSKGVKRNQALYLLISWLFGFGGGSTNPITIFFPSFLSYEIYLVGQLGIAVYSIIAAYATLRYRLLDIKLVLKKSMVYSFSAGILTSLFVVLVLAMTKFFSNMAGITSFAITVIAALIIAALFNPLRIKIQDLVDRIFYKKSYDYYSIVRQVSSTLASMFDINNIYKFIGNIIYETLGVNGVSLLSATSGGGFETIYQTSRKHHKTKPEGESLRLDDRSGIVELCRESKETIVKDELPAIKETIEPETVEMIKNEFEHFNSGAVVPVFVDGQLSLLIVMGEKISGDMFSDEDINLLGTISEQTATAMKNARLYSDKVNTDRLASIGMMSATFAHEIRNPLTSLKTFAQLMPEKYNDAEFRGTFSRIVEGEIEKIDGLISDLLDFSTEKQASRIHNFNLVDVVDETVNYVKSKFDIQSKNISIEKDYAENEINMTGDVTKLQQAFVNIMTNGCQAMNGEGLLRVGVKRNENHVEVEIADSGEGISSNDISRIFDPFITTKEMGVGLGLAISKRIIEDHEGSINVQSKLSEGTVFTIFLPVKN